ncbi:hypothetical protein HCZ30_11085 [Marivivens donghaensis]|uniref:Uncharacterized protein n=1 Tax=Marivivens donghaensis TaxID=1699413 RepID=A0ABX0VY29_9RHOB|nr:hypothetical protein [Marivivens donghaensis]NIY72974.1 hypothetical protein [Marivivens donghaensis]
MGAIGLLSADTPATAVKMLVIGSRDVWPNHDTSDDGFNFVDYRSFSAEMLEQFKPDMVMSLLFGTGFDAMDIAAKLFEFGFAGPYRALCANLPNPALVKREISQVAPLLDFDLVSLPAVARMIH